MGNIKQRLLKAGTSYNYAEGVKVKATTAVYADQIVYPTGSSGPFITVATADSDAGNVGSAGRLLIAKHDIPASGYGVCLPWKLVTTIATTGHTVGDPIYLADTPGTSVGSNLVRACPTGDAKATIVGRITVVGAAGTGAILVNASAPEERVQGGTIAGQAGQTTVLTNGRPVEQLCISTAASTDDQDFTLEYPIVITGMAVVAKANTATCTVNLYKGDTTDVIAIAVATGNTINLKTFTTGIVPANCIIPAETIIRIDKTTSAGTLGDLVIIDYIRG